MELNNFKAYNLSRETEVHIAKSINFDAQTVQPEADKEAGRFRNLQLGDNQVTVANQAQGESPSQQDPRLVDTLSFKELFRIKQFRFALLKHLAALFVLLFIFALCIIFRQMGQTYFIYSRLGGGLNSTNQTNQTLSV